MIRTSDAFVAFRQAVIEELNAEISNNLVPVFNSTVIDIEKDYDLGITGSKDANTERAALALVRSAERNRDARILDLKLKRQDFLNTIQMRLKMEMDELVKGYNGEVFTEVEKRFNGKMGPVIRAKFPDGSSAKIPQHVHIHWDQFEQV